MSRVTTWTRRLRGVDSLDLIIVANLLDSPSPVHKTDPQRTAIASPQHLLSEKRETRDQVQRRMKEFRCNVL